MKWEISIEAAIAAMQFCQEQKGPITKKQLVDHLQTVKKINIPETSFRTIWGKLPDNFKQGAGRPPKK
jgi:hypothetical protein